MKSVPLIVLAAAMVLPNLADESKPRLDTTPLSAEEMAVYTAFLKSYLGNGHDAVNLANRTSILDIQNPSSECLKGITLENLKIAKSTIHALNADPAIPWPAGIKLVDAEAQEASVARNDPGRTIFREGKDVNSAVNAAFKSGLMTIAEIAFDKAHRYAVMSFSFECGELCGHGGTIVLEKTHGVWRRTQRFCGSWIS